jgi:hypothetical protein
MVSLFREGERCERTAVQNAYLFGYFEMVVFELIFLLGDVYYCKCYESRVSKFLLLLLIALPQSNAMGVTAFEWGPRVQLEANKCWED